MSKAFLIGQRPRPPKPDLTLDCTLFLGLVLLAGVLLMWHMLPAKQATISVNPHSVAQR
jgi:hypothetical protein